MLTNVQHSQLVSEIAAEVEQRLRDSEGGHDWWHIKRVWHNAQIISQSEQNIDIFVVELAALLHDIADSKFHGGDEEIGPHTARTILMNHQVDLVVVDHVVNIIRFMSFKNSLEDVKWTSPELEVVQDADRLDAIGAIGIARAFNYGGFKNRSMFDPAIAPVVNLSKEEYKKSQTPTINHFYEKLLKLKDLMNTKTGMKLAQQRHEYMIEFLNQFYNEVGTIPPWHSISSNLGSSLKKK